MYVALCTYVALPVHELPYGFDTFTIDVSYEGTRLAGPLAIAVRLFWTPCWKPWIVLAHCEGDIGA